MKRITLLLLLGLVTAVLLVVGSRRYLASRHAPAAPVNVAATAEPVVCPPGADLPAHSPADAIPVAEAERGNLARTVPASHSAWPGAKVLAFAEEAPMDGLSRRSTLLQPTNFPYAVLVEEKLNGLDAPDEARVVQRSEQVANHLLVKLRSGQTVERLSAIAGQFGGRVRLHPTAAGLYLVGLPEPKLDGVAQARAILRQFPETIEYAEPDFIVRAAGSVPDDPRFPEQWNVKNTGQGGGTPETDIDAPGAWDIRREATNVVVAVVDSGIRYTHEDLSGNLWKNAGEIPGNGVDDDGDGIVDDVYGINAIEDTGDPMDDLPDPELGQGGHGTAVAGVLGAVGNNGKGISGVAWKVQLMALKWFNNQGAGALSDAIQCLDYARTHGAAIVNASWQQGGLLSDEVNQSMMDALDRLRQAGIIFVCSAGNDGLNNDLVAHYPSNYPFDNIVAVAAATSAGSLWRKSNFGERLVDLAAPGEGILSVSSKADNEYSIVSGTSFAAPHVTGILALLKAEFPAADYRGLINRLLSGAERGDRLTGKVRTGAIANLQRALSATDVLEFPEITELKLNDQLLVGQGEVSVLQGTNVTLAVTAAGALPLTYFWQRDGRAIAGATNASYSIASFATSDIGEYRVSVSNRAGVASLSVRLLGVVQRPELAVAVNAPGSPFVSSGNNLWGSQATITRDGVSAGASGQIAARQGTLASTSVTGPGRLSFSWRVSSERDNDTLDLLIDDNVIESISGEVAWARREFAVSPGPHEVRWRYVKDASLSKGEDRGYLDLFEFAPDGKIAPTISTQPANQFVVEGQPAFFTVIAAGSEPFRYQWQKDGVNIGGATSNRLELSAATLADEGRYSVLVRNEAGSTASAAARLTVSPAAVAPRFTLQPADAATSAGAAITLTSAVAGTPPLVFRWVKDGAELPAETNAVLELKNPSRSDSGAYYAVVTNLAGTATSRVAKVSVVEVQMAPVIVKQPVGFMLYAGETVDLTVEVSGLGPFTYQWLRNGKVLAGQNRAELVITNAQHLDTGYYEATVGNPFGTTSSRKVLVRVNVSMPELEQSVENSEFTWCTGGDAPWYRQTEVTADGEDALQSGGILDNGYSEIMAVATGPGRLSFQWKVSSEPNYDFLDFYVDDEIVDGISGDWGWEESVWNIPEGVHVLMWRYSKDETFSDGEDSGWLDQVLFVSSNKQSPIVVQHPVSQSGFPGDEITFQAEAAGSLPLSFRWYRDGSPIAGGEQGTLRLTNVAAADLGSYHVVVSNRFGIATSHDAKLLLFDKATAVESALNRPDLLWSNYGYASWFPQIESSADGSSAMQSRPIGDDGVAWLGSEIEGPGVLYFFWKVSSEEDYDFLEFLLDDDLYDAISGEVEWQDTSVLIPPGRHSVDWVYVKDGLDSAGADAGWLDVVEFYPLSTFEYWKNLMFTSGQLLQSTVSADSADPDRDGRSNLAEYAFGLDPLFSGDAVPVWTGLERREEESFFVLSYQRLVNDPSIRYQIEVSSDLVNWTWSPGSDWVETATPGDDLYETVRLRYRISTVAAGKFFCRVRVVREP